MPMSKWTQATLAGVGILALTGCAAQPETARPAHGSSQARADQVSDAGQSPQAISQGDGTTLAVTPPARPSNEAEIEQLQLAKMQGNALRAALQHMIEKEAQGSTTRAGEYVVAYAIEDAEGLYVMQNGRLTWREPEQENAHIEIAVMDGADGRFVPGLSVHVTLTDGTGQEVGTHRQEFYWHPWLYHYGRNWTVPGDGLYTLRVRIDPPTFPRHDKINGQRFAEPVEVVFPEVKIETGQKKS